MARKTPEINSSSMADIAFLMLAFFLMTTTMDQDKGLLRRLPAWPDPNQKVENVQVNKRNLVEIRINSRNNLFAAGRPLDVSELRDLIIEYLTNPTEDENLPKREMTMIDNFGEYPVTQAVISLQNDRETSYEAYIKVQNELVKAINELRDNFAMQYYGKKFIQLDEAGQKVVSLAIPQVISEAEPKDVSKK